MGYSTYGAIAIIFVIRKTEEPRSILTHGCLNDGKVCQKTLHHPNAAEFYSGSDSFSLVAFVLAHEFNEQDPYTTFHYTQPLRYDLSDLQSDRCAHFGFASFALPL